MPCVEQPLIPISEIPAEGSALVDFFGWQLHVLVGEATNRPPFDGDDAMNATIETMAVTKDQITECGEVLAWAFYDDPLMKYIVPDDAKRARWLRWFMTKGANYAHHYGHVDTTAAKVEGGAIWLVRLSLASTLFPASSVRPSAQASLLTACC